MQQEGILTGCDKNHEWLLQWWWENYLEHNSYPVAFVDFGMSESGLAWCKERGICFQAPYIQLPRKEVSPERKKLWEEHYGKGIWQHREVCLRKPLAFARSPFSSTIWIDLDCRVRNSVAPLFQILSLGVHISMMKEREKVQETHRKKGFLHPDEINFNSGVVLFQTHQSILRHWVQEIHERSEEFVFDQHGFSRAYRLHPNTPFMDLLEIYNWSPWDGPNPHALIYHFHGGYMKDPAMMSLFP
ncbi:MAG: hypothetical protein FJZ64_00335 [Chlamydiae bacterium]|nr:hypothetical protein [Chlamydiota bacterium]